MDKGIRPFANARFAALNPSRKAGTISNTEFRKSIIAECMEQFGITLAAAATHYNHAFKAYKAANPTEVEGLGRPPEKNNGGRKPKAPAAPPTAEELTAQIAALQAQLAAVQQPAGDAPQEPTGDAPQEPAGDAPQEPQAEAPQEPVQEQPAADAAPQEPAQQEEAAPQEQPAAEVAAPKRNSKKGKKAAEAAA
jgi:hypothetical protein